VSVYSFMVAATLSFTLLLFSVFHEEQ